MRNIHKLSVLSLLLVVTCAVPALADDVRPSSLDVREVTGGRFEARLRTPLRGGKRLKVRPKLPEGARVVEGSYARSVAGDALLETFVFTAAVGLAGQEIGVDGPGLASRGALLRVYLRDGRTLRSMLTTKRPTLLVEKPDMDVPVAWTERAAEAAREALSHALTNPAHLLFAAALALAASNGAWLLALACFLVLQVLGSLVGPVPALTPPLGEAALALVAIFAAREALRGSARRLALLAALAGVAHGLGNSVSGGVLEALASGCGMDLAHVVIGAVVAVGLRSVRRRAVRSAAAFTAGVFSVALAVTLAAATEAPAAQPVLPLALVSDQAEEAPPAPVQGIQTDIEAYLDVGVFDTRVEILGRLEPIAAWIGIEDVPATISVAAQDVLLGRVATGVLARTSVMIDGTSARPDAVRSGFAEQVATGTYIRQESQLEKRAEALVGLIYTFRGPTIPKDVSVSWAALPGGLTAMRTRTIDPELSREVRLKPDAPTLAWTNALTEDPLPSVEAVGVRRTPVPLPLFSLAVLAFVVLGTWLLRRRVPHAFGTGARVGLALALFAAPVFALDVPAWSEGDADPTPGQARALVRALVENTYFALNIRDESAVYDRLALSLVEPALTTAFIANRKALTFEQAGGARTYINAVELLGLEDITPVEGGGFTALARWSVAGSVTHFGHRHFRRNLYTARLGLRAAEDAWTIHAFDVEEIERKR